MLNVISNRLFIRTLAFGAALLAFFPVASVFGESLAWQTDYAAAKTAATQQNKYILLDFTGSDWCPYCIKMDKEVFNKPAFSTFAGEKLILVKLDFPRNANQSAAERAQNQELAKKYGIEGFPTYVLLDSTGKEVRRQVGYLEGGPQAFISWAQGKVAASQ
ncbi:MAG TPA: thioredoxin family protein [Chthoniobacterales bacterium]|jgi:protein disulfide-isomerase|nr:thioredoxin family protein [Chthoniobacterales bacterium]